MIAAHLESYRDSIRRDALEDTAGYARATPTKNPDRYPTVYDFLYTSLMNAKQSISSDNEEGYKYWVLQHRAVLVKLHELRVKDVTEGESTRAEVLEFIKEKGWRWFKFCSQTVELELDLGNGFVPQVLLVPRYLKKWEGAWLQKGLCVLDADEMDLLLEMHNPEIDHEVIRFKQINPGFKIVRVEAGNITYNAIADYNSGGPVLDWSLSIFGEDT